MQPKFENKLASFIKVHDLFSSASKVVLAVSGGADSMALLYGMQALKAKSILKTDFICAHVNHQLRGAEADLDEKFVIAEAAKFKLHVITKRVDVREFARDHKLSIETAARQCRLTALTEIAKTKHCERIAMAHQKNDNAETVLHRLVRGTGFRGLSGIWPKRLFADGVTLIRPMLCVTRDEVIEYLQSRNLTWRRDRTNTDCTYRRNFIRHRLLPVLQRDCSDTLVETLSGLSHSALGFYSRVCERADVVWPGLVECTTGLVTLDRKKFQAQSPPVKVELIRRSLIHLGCGQRDLTRRHYEHIIRLAKQNVTGRRIELPSGFVVRYEYGSVIVSRNYTMGCRAYFGSPVKLEVPGKTKFGKYLIEATVCQIDEDELKSIDTLSHAARCLDCTRHEKKGYIERFDLGKIKLPLRIRNRRPGDRFVPLGLSGEKKIDKFLTAQHVPYKIREKVILIEDLEKIIWVWPIRISERVKVTSVTRQILQLQMRNFEGT